MESSACKASLRTAPAAGRAFTQVLLPVPIILKPPPTLTPGTVELWESLRQSRRVSCWTKSIWLLSRHWREAYLREKYIEIDDWPDHELLDPLHRLTILCSEALSRATDVV